MLHWSLVFLVIAIIAALLGFGGIAGVPLLWSVDFNVNPMCSVLTQRVGRVRANDELCCDYRS